MSDQILSMYERMASTGTAPDEGCVLFGVGYEDAYSRLISKYLQGRLRRGDSAEKFVIGPFGSGKTHFMRQLMELARQMSGVTAEVKLDKNIDFTDGLAVYKEIIRSIRTPEGGRGLDQLLVSMAARIAMTTEDEATARELVAAWAAGLEQIDLELPSFAAVARTAFTAMANGDEALLESAKRWIAGEVGDRVLSRELRVAQIPTARQTHHGKKALLSLLQLIRAAGYMGTVICYDEAEQGLEVNKQKTQRILSMFQSDINAVADVRNASVLIMYGITPDIFGKMEGFAALQQRVADPVPGRDFLAGDAYAPRIDLTQRADDLADLTAIAERLVQVFHDAFGARASKSFAELTDAGRSIANGVHDEDVRAGNRRTLVKRVCSMLLSELQDFEPGEPAVVEAEV